jgi:hypothetical protein
MQVLGSKKIQVGMPTAGGLLTALLKMRPNLLLSRRRRRRVDKE